MGGPSLAGAAPFKPITGKLNKPGYTVIALAANGQARSVIAKRGSFRVVPPAAMVTLQLRASDGVYAGPIVLQEKGAKRKPHLAIVGVKAGAPLGNITVNSVAGYALARLSKRVWKARVDTTRWARAKNGVPIGAGNFGRVLSPPPRVSPPGDLDADGIPDVLDIDMNGNLILNDVDRSTSTASRARASQAQQRLFYPRTSLLLTGGSSLKAGVFTPIGQPVNVNAPGLSEADINAALVSYELLSVGAANGPYASGELDCGGLSYCSAGGTGVHLDNQHFPFQINPEPFPSCCEANGNGLGSLDPNPNGKGGLGLLLAPRATADQIRAGDVLLIHATCKWPVPCGPTPGTCCTPEYAMTLPGTLDSVFATVPALASYTDALGTHEVSYPIAHGAPIGSGPGTTLPVVAGLGGGTNVSVRLTFWRPQRRAVPGEVPAGAGQWIDMGGLIQFATGGQGGTPCPASAYSDVDPSLIASVQTLPGDKRASVFIDLAHDQPADPHNAFSYTLDLSQCLAAAGVPWGNGPAGTTPFTFSALFPPVAGQPASGATSGYYFYLKAPAEPSFTIEKLQRIAGEGSYSAAEHMGELGKTVEYKIVVKNTGNVSLKFGSLKDTGCEGITPAGATELAAGTPPEESFSCTHTLSAVGAYTNEATIEGNEGTGSKTSNKVTVQP